MNGGLAVNGRIYIVFGMLAMAIVALGGRLAWVVRDDSHQVDAYAEKQMRRIIVQPGRPGSVLGRTHNGSQLLASSKQSPSCFVDPTVMDDKSIADVSLALGGILGESPLAIQELIVSRRDKRFAMVKENITVKQEKAIRELKLRPVGIVYEWRRYYPCGDLARTVVGYRHADGAPGGGIEQSQYSHISAEAGKRVVLTDARRRAIWLDAERSTAPRDGDSVMLCLDVVVQTYLQKAVKKAVSQFGAKWGTGVVADPRTGEILALYSARGRAGEATSERGADRAIAMPYEPGSVMKPLYAAAAVDCGRFSYNTMIHCENGSYSARGGGTLRDTHAYGKLSLTDVVVHSSNIGMAKVGENLGNKRLHEIAIRYGFNKKTGIELGGESKGQVRPLPDWDGYSNRRVPFGHEISTTVLQLTMAFCSLANGGELLRPRLVDHIRGASGKVLWRSHREVVRRTVSRATANATMAVMQQVVERGTGKACKLDNWTSAGKTGTAQIPGRGGYIDGAYAGSFVGVAPASAPRVVCTIMVYWPDRSKGYYGSKVAAPFVKDVLHKTLVHLDVPPDKQDAVAEAR